MTTIDNNEVNTTVDTAAPVKGKRGGKNVTVTTNTDAPDFKKLVTALAKESSWEDIYNKLTAVSESKSAKATAIYKKLMAEGKARKDIINLFKSELNMTDAGASTYYQNIKKSTAKN